MVNWLSVPSVIVYIFGMPAFFMWALKTNRSKEDFSSRFGFLSVGMNEDLYYWEVVLMIVKAAVICTCEVLTSVSNEVQVLVSIIIFLIHLVVTLKIRPMSSDSSNKMQIFSQIVQMLILYTGLFYITGTGKWWMEGSIDWLFIPFLFLPSIVFLLMWLNSAVKQFLIIIYKQSPERFKMVTCSLLDPDEFYKQNIAPVSEAVENSYTSKDQITPLAEKAQRSSAEAAAKALIAST